MWDHIDGLGSAGERSVVEGLIAGNREWQVKYRELLDVHQAMTGAELDMPSLRFSKNVMEEIARNQITPATNSYINKNIIRGIGAFFLTTIGGALIYTFTQITFQGNHSSSLPMRYNRELQDRLNNFNLGRIFNSTSMNIFIMINLVLGLMLLDMWLGRRKRQTGHPEA